MASLARLETGLRLLLALVVTGAGISELAAAEPVRRSLQVLGYPAYLMPLLGVTKLSAAFALVASVPRWVREWAYAGLVFDFALATASFICARQVLLPDVVVAPGYLVLALASVTFSRKRVLLTP
jgi:hypothetical protein